MCYPYIALKAYTVVLVKQPNGVTQTNFGMQSNIVSSGLRAAG